MYVCSLSSGMEKMEVYRLSASSQGMPDAAACMCTNACSCIPLQNVDVSRPLLSVCLSIGVLSTIAYLALTGLAMHSSRQALCVWVLPRCATHGMPAGLMSPARHAAQRDLPLISFLDQGGVFAAWHAAVRCCALSCMWCVLLTWQHRCFCHCALYFKALCCSCCYWVGWHVSYVEPLKGG